MPEFLEGEARRPGMPPWEQVVYRGDATTRRAAWDWLRKLEAYLQEQIDQGIMTVEEAGSIWQHQYGRLFPEAGWKERQPTAVERYRQQMAGELSAEQIAAGAGNPIREWDVPTPTELVDLDMFASVKTFIGGLVSDRRAQLDEAAGLYAEAQQEFINQQANLPLGVRGEPAEQMWAASEAIRNLRLRQASLAQTKNPYMQTTLDLIESQVGQLRSAQDQIRETYRAGLRAEGEPKAGQPWQRPGMPAPSGKDYAGLLEELPYTAQQYFAGRQEELYGEFEQAMPGARAAWWRAVHPEPGDPWGGMRGESLARYAEEMGMSTEAMRRTAVRYKTQPESSEFERLTKGERQMLGRLGRKSKRERRVKTQDPWEVWRAEYPFMEKFLEVPRAQRGFFPRRSVARGRWFV